MDRDQAIEDVSKKTWDNAIPALLRGYRRIYNKWSVIKKGCVQNIQKSQKYSILGLVFKSLSDKEINKIRDRELWGKHYDSVRVKVELPQVSEPSIVTAITSMARQEMVRTGRIASKYQEIVESAIKKAQQRYKTIDFWRNYLDNTFDSHNRPIEPS